MSLKKINIYYANEDYHKILGGQKKLEAADITKEEAYIDQNVKFEISSILEQSKQTIKVIRSLDGIKNVKFLPTVKFNRS